MFKKRTSFHPHLLVVTAEGKCTWNDQHSESKRWHVLGFVSYSPRRRIMRCEVISLMLICRWCLNELLHRATTDSACRLVSVCTHRPEKIRGPRLKVAMQTANLRVNGHFLWPRPQSVSGWLRGQSCLRLPFFALRSPSEWNGSLARRAGAPPGAPPGASLYPQCRTLILTTCWRGMRPYDH